MTRRRRAYVPGPAPIVNLPPPPREVQENVARVLIDLFARRALEDLGVLPVTVSGDAPVEGARLRPIYVSADTHRRVLRLTSRLAKQGWAAHGIGRDDIPTAGAVVDEAVTALSRQLRRIRR